MPATDLQDVVATPPETAGAVDDGYGIVTMAAAEDAAAAVRVSEFEKNFPADNKKRGLVEWLWSLVGRKLTTDRKNSPGRVAEGGELQTMLTASDNVHLGDVCLLEESPFVLIKAAESGSIKEFERLYHRDPNRLCSSDGNGRSVAHQAAARNHLDIIRFYHSHGGELGLRDNSGNTPLHLAIIHDSLDALDLLMSLGANAEILNNMKQSIIHLATELNKVQSLLLLVRYKDKVNVNQGGEHGRTALHLAAIYDHDQCAMILIKDLASNPCRPCDNGYYPIHEAAKHASSRTMEVLIRWGESRGRSRESLMSQLDSEGNLPLHSAVHGGDIKAVELCICSGAKISTQQGDGSTPVHLACSQGALEIVTLMFNAQPEEKQICLFSCDVQKMTPLHCAAMFDHVEVVTYLVKEGAHLDQLDKERRSPMLLAASRRCWRTVKALMALGADVNLRDMKERNVLHLVVMHRGPLAPVAGGCMLVGSEVNLSHLMNDRDVAGCSPLHYASRAGFIRSLKNLIDLGASVNIKNKNNESPLHFAARYGRYNTTVRLLDSQKGPFIVNETDGNGQTALHIASSEGHVRVVQLLVNRGALLQRDHNGRNPLHLAAMNGHTRTVEILHLVHSQMMDHCDKEKNSVLHLAAMEKKPNSVSMLLSMGCRLTYNKKGMSALDYAIYYKYQEVALAMVNHETRSSEVMALQSEKNPCVTMALIANMPNVFNAVLDRCITKADCKKDSKSFYVKYDFRVIEAPGIEACPLAALNIKYCFKHYQKSKSEIDAQRITLNDPKYRPPPLSVINAMVAHGRVELLAHPLSQKYLQMKWNSYGKYFHLVHLLFYCIFLTFITMYSFLLMNLVEKTSKSADESTKPSQSTDLFQQVDKEKQNADNMALMTVSAVAILSYTLMCITYEVCSMTQSKWNYFLDAMTLASWLLYIATVLMVCPTFMGIFNNVQYSAAASAVFLAWFHLLLLLQRFDQVGIYVVMFLEILQTLIRVLCVFSILIIAFGLSFHILLAQGNHLPFKTVPMSLMRTFTMMLGELDFIGTYVEPYYQAVETGKLLSYPEAVFVILAIFLVLMPILLMNLLIGLAVGDIESVRRNAQLKRLAMQVILHTELEKKIPAFLLAKVDKNELIEYPNDITCKVSLIESIMRKWFCNPYTEEASMDKGIESKEDIIFAEVYKLKALFNDMSESSSKQYDLLRLIVQKMEINSEADDADEGVSSDAPMLGARFQSPAVRAQIRN